MKRRSFALASLGLQVAGFVSAQEAQMSNNFEIKVGSYRFTLTSSREPEKQFFRIEPTVSLEDQNLFRNSDSAQLLKAHWSFKEFLQSRMLGVVEVQVLLRNSKELFSDDESLSKAITSYFLRELQKLQYVGGSFPIQPVTINGRRWMNYRVPVLGTYEYSAYLTPNRYLTVQISIIDNTGESNPRWVKDADAFASALVATAKLEKA